MSDSEDDFVQVYYYSSSSDSEWEKIEAESSENEEVEASAASTSSPDSIENKPSDAPPAQQEAPVVTWKDVTPVEKDAPSAPPKKKKNSRRKEKRAARRAEQGERQEQGQGQGEQGGVRKERRRRKWCKIIPKATKGIITPEDPVAALGVTEEDATFLSLYSIFTVGELACFNVMSVAQETDPNFARFLDLQERASEIATEYLTKATDLTPVWGYHYLEEAAVTRVIRSGYLECDSLKFLWSPMPFGIHEDCKAIDRLVGKETGNPKICDRYARIVKINLMTLCENYEANLFQKEGNAWVPIRPTEADAWTSREDMWTAFQPGTDIFDTVPHGKIVIPSGKIPLACLEFDHPVNLPAPGEDEDPRHSLTPYLKWDSREGDLNKNYFAAKFSKKSYYLRVPL